MKTCNLLHRLTQGLLHVMTALLQINCYQNRCCSIYCKSKQQFEFTLTRLINRLISFICVSELLGHHHCLTWRMTSSRNKKVCLLRSNGQPFRNSWNPADVLLYPYSEATIDRLQQHLRCCHGDVSHRERKHKLSLTKSRKCRLSVPINTSSSSVSLTYSSNVINEKDAETF